MKKINEVTVNFKVKLNFRLYDVVVVVVIVNVVVVVVIVNVVVVVVVVSVVIFANDIKTKTFHIIFTN